MGGYGGYGKQNDIIKRIIQELNKLIDEINNIQENIYGEKLYVEWGTTSKQKVSDFINKNLDSNEILLLQLEKINCIVMAESELIEAIEKLVHFCNKIKDLLNKSKDLTDFHKWVELSNYKDELDAQKEKLNTKVEEFNTLLDNANSVNSQFDQKSKEAFNKFFLNKEGNSYREAERKAKINAIIWLLASIILSLVLIFVVCFRSTNVSGLIEIRQDLCCLAIQDKTMLYIAYGKYISSYVLIYSILIYALKVSVKNYNANKHNEIVNRNKKLTLSVAIDLSREGNNPELLDIAAKELFSSQPTGYNNTNEEKSTSNFVNNIVETVSKKV
ncbi:MULTISPECIES: hypothetical protein [Flavobacterium]|uniref:Uncharacterized protein n=1 Tax=Flavobacterium keumense TaxID=1306518 RepID=A0ABY8N3S3_9FLAO|nr:MULTISPECIES: hypothetical protein [Flavobacterium]WGK94305.1 hypothetical protein MG292_09490 [Flavobacterium keumense]